MAEEKVTSGRGPGYPFIPLDKALERIKLVYDAGVRDRPFAPATFYKTWGIGAKSSSARQIMAALKHYELVDYEGFGKDRKVGMTPIALQIIQDKRPDSQERKSAIKKVALTPNIYGKLYKQFPPPMPEDVFIEHVLINDYGYSEAAAQSVLKGYKRTISFANLDKPDSLPVSETEKADDDIEDLGGNEPQIEIGDLIQGTVNGKDQFPQGATVLGFSDDKNWIFHSFGKAALEVKDATIMQKGKESHGAPPAMPADMMAKVLQFTESADSNEHTEFTVLTSGKVKSGKFQLRVSGDMNAKDMRRMMKILKVQMKVLQEDDEEAGDMSGS